MMPEIGNGLLCLALGIALLLSVYPLWGVCGKHGTGRYSPRCR